MRTIYSNCPFCEKETKQDAVVESYLDVSGYVIIVNYWTRCLECGNNLINKIKEIERSIMLDETTLETILNKIFQLQAPPINSSRRPQISEFIKSIINGDTPREYLVINCNLGKDREGALIYILTNLRLIKIEVDASTFSASTPFLATIINIDKKIGEGMKAQVKIDFQNDSFGLIYAANNQEINEFFQKVDSARVQVKI